MSTSQSGRTPRRTTRRSTATPIRDLSPPVHNTRSVSSAVYDEAATRRSTRAASKRLEQYEDGVNNKALPEVQIRQSYAYGASKTPLLPDQLHVRDPLSIGQVANHMDDAMNRAQQNLDSHRNERGLGQQQDQPTKEINGRSKQKRASKEPSPPASVNTDLAKKQRTAAWADSLEDSHLDDIEEEGDDEEEQPEIDTPETRRTDPSSFPSGVFDQSYQYERGLRPPRKPPKTKQSTFSARVRAATDRFVLLAQYTRQRLLQFYEAIREWNIRIMKTISGVITTLPDSPVIIHLTRAFFIIVLAGFMNYALCFAYSRYLCDVSSTSRISQTLQSWCSGCQSNHNLTHFPSIGSEVDFQKLTAALKHVDSQIRNIESRVNSRMDNHFSAIHADVDSLRKDQSNLVEQLDQINNQPPPIHHPPTYIDVASPIIPRVNFFSPANGAVVNPHYTSPTRQAPLALPIRILTRMLGIYKYNAHNPITALESWNDVGDCWCAASSAPGQDSVRLGVSIKEYIYPTELVIEHPSRDATLMPETAPKIVELWADFGHLTATEWKELGVDVLNKPQQYGQTAGDMAGDGPIGKGYGLVANVEYNLAGEESDVKQMQMFALDVNQDGHLKYAAREFVVRVRETHGAEYGCLYRVRLHGVPVKKRKVGGMDEGEEGGGRGEKGDVVYGSGSSQSS